jgi:hypothetical protein
MVTSSYIFLSVFSIVAGGLISAFSARKPSRQTAWVSAYLVLVVGIVQLGLVTLWHRFGNPNPGTTTLALLIFNVGNVTVLYGTLRKRQLKYYRILVNAGGGLIALGMALLLFAVRSQHASLSLVEFIVLTAIILLSIPAGLFISYRRHRELTN